MNIVDDTIKAQRLQTTNLIETAGRIITLYRKPGLINDGAGGKKRSTGHSSQLAPRMRYFGGTLGLGRGAVTSPVEWLTTSLGEKYKSFYVLVGEYDDDIRVGDYFFLNNDQNKRYEVLFLHEDVDEYQTKATVGLEK